MGNGEKLLTYLNSVLKVLLGLDTFPRVPNKKLRFVVQRKLTRKNQYRFTPQTFTADAVIALKDFVDHLNDGQYIALVSLDVQGAFDAVWWPSILSSLKKLKCPSNSYNPCVSYFSERSATSLLNSSKEQRKRSKENPQGLAPGPSFWNFQYNSLLNLEYTKNVYTKVQCKSFLDVFQI
jgi:hypothetical protein